MNLSYPRQQVIGHFGGGPDAVERLLDLLRLGRLDLSRSVSGTLPLADAPAAVGR